MADLSRGEHIARAEELLREARKVDVHAKLNGGESNAAQLIAEAQVHATLAVALTQPVVAAGPPASPFKEMFGGQFGNVS